MLGEAHVGKVILWTNDKAIRNSLEKINYKNMTLKDSPLKGEIDEVINSCIDESIPINNLDRVTKRHYKEELAVFYDEYKESILKNQKSISINVINVNEINSVNEISNLDGAINILTGREFSQKEIRELKIKGKLVTAISDLEKCLSFVRYLYIFNNSIIYFTEDFEMLFSNINGKVLKDVIVTDTYKEIKKYFNRIYEEKSKGTFIAMQKAGDLKYFGDFLVNLQDGLEIGECKLFCNEYYNSENNDEYLVGIVI